MIFSSCLGFDENTTYNISLVSIKRRLLSRFLAKSIPMYNSETGTITQKHFQGKLATHARPYHEKYPLPGPI